MARWTPTTSSVGRLGPSRTASASGFCLRTLVIISVESSGFRDEEPELPVLTRKLTLVASSRQSNSCWAWPTLCSHNPFAQQQDRRARSGSCRRRELPPPAS